MTRLELLKHIQKKVEEIFYTLPHGRFKLGVISNHLQELIGECEIEREVEEKKPEETEK